MNSNVFDDVYEEYIENILSISSLSDKDHYIFYKFNIVDDTCHDEIYMLNQKGEKGEFGNKNFKYNDDLYNKFLKKLVNKFYSNNSIKTKDIIYNDDDDGTFRMITENKDIFTVSGLSKEKNEDLLNTVKSNDYKENKEYVLTNDKGKVNYLLLIFIIALLIIILALIIFL